MVQIIDGYFQESLTAFLEEEGEAFLVQIIGIYEPEDPLFPESLVVVMVV